MQQSNAKSEMLKKLLLRLRDDPAVFELAKSCGTAFGKPWLTPGQLDDEHAVGISALLDMVLPSLVVDELIIPTPGSQNFCFPLDMVQWLEDNKIDLIMIPKFYAGAETVQPRAIMHYYFDFGAFIAG